MIQCKTILLDDNYQIHLDPVRDNVELSIKRQVELAVKRKSRFGLDELVRVRLTKAQCEGLAREIMKEAA